MASESKTAEDPQPLPYAYDESERRAVLRRALVSALRAGRHGKLVAHEAPTTERKPWRIGLALLFILVAWYPGATFAERRGIAFGWWPLIAAVWFLGILMLLGFVVQAAQRIGIPGVVARVGSALGTLFALALLLAGPVTLAAQVNDGHSVWLTHVAPTAAATLVALLTRSVDIRSARDIGVAVAAVVRSAPLLAPLALVVLVLPAVSADVWQAAVLIDLEDVGILLLITVLPLSALVARQLLREVPAVLASRARWLAEQPNRADSTRRMLNERLDSPVAASVLTLAGAEIEPAWPSHPAEYAPIIAASEGSALRDPLLGRLAVCVVVVAVVSSAYLYAVLAVVIDPAVAGGWVREPVPTTVVQFAGVEAVLPGGIYLQVVALLGTLATAISLAFVLLEDRFSSALRDSLVRLPADDLLVLCIPYLSLREQRIACDDDRGDQFDPGSLA